MEETPARFRFSTANLLWLTSWIGLWLAAWVLIAGGRIYEADGMLHILLQLVLVLEPLFIPPFAVFGLLVGRMWSGAAYGAVIALLFLIGIMAIAR